MIELSVVIPTYNERENIPVLIQILKDLLQGKVEFEILVADDDSPDGTWQVVEELAKADNRIVCLRRMQNKGLSASVIDGFLKARGKYLAVLDADMQHDESLLPKMLEIIPQFDLVVGSRHTEEGGIKDWSGSRRFVSWVAGLMARLTINPRISDPMSGFFMVRKEAFERIHHQVRTRGFKILLEILVHLDRSRITELGYVFKPRQMGESKLDSKVIFDYLLQLYELRFGSVLPWDFVKFCLVGGSGVLVNLLGLYLFQALGFSKEISLVSGIGISMLSNYLLNNWWTFKENRKSGWGLLTSLGKFVLTCSAGALINYAVTLYLHNSWGMNLYLADLLGILLSTLWNYSFSRRWVWSRG